MNGLTGKAPFISVTEGEKVYKLFVIAILISVFFLPSFTVVQGLAEFRVEDFLLPIVAILLILRKKLKKDSVVLISMLFSVYILFTIVLNGRLGQYRDYFEVYKMLKFILLYLFFCDVNWQAKTDSFFVPIFIGLAIFNIAQYFNILGFNTLIEPYYAEPIQLDTFGLNSIGQPDVKRLLGTLGNPNNNSVIWLFFVSLFFITSTASRFQYGLFITAFIGLLACQSRTAFLSFIILFVINLVVRNYSARQRVQIIATVSVVFGLFFWLVNASYLGSLLNPEVGKTHSVKGRLEIWTELYGMIIRKPFFGYGPFKEYFYDNGIYPESEYILILWRYGIAGLIIFAAWLYIPFVKAWQKRPAGLAIALCSFIGMLALNALTNTPLQEPRILAMFALSCAAIASMKNNLTKDVPIIDSRK